MEFKSSIKQSERNGKNKLAIISGTSLVMKSILNKIP
jgi:hypothetical protein